MKRVYAISLLFAVCSALCPAIQAQMRSQELFNGTNLDGWGFILRDPNVKAGEVFKVEGGVIHITGNPFGYMYTEQEFSDFYLQVEWRWPDKGSNSGIFLYVQDERKVWPHGIECQLAAGAAGDFIGIQGTGLAEAPSPSPRIENRFPKKIGDSSENPVGEWNKADIFCRDGLITVLINSIFQNIGISSQYKSGRIALQSEGGAIEFRNIRITEISE
jgi:hypothetical protein